MVESPKMYQRAPVRPPRWRAAPADTAESADVQFPTAPVDREAATKRENGCYPEPEKLLG